MCTLMESADTYFETQQKLPHCENVWIIVSVVTSIFFATETMIEGLNVFALQNAIALLRTSSFTVIGQHWGSSAAITSV